jgi:hypothetical protein
LVEDVGLAVELVDFEPVVFVTADPVTVGPVLADVVVAGAVNSEFQ